MCAYRHEGQRVGDPIKGQEKYAGKFDQKPVHSFGEALCAWRLGQDVALGFPNEFRGSWPYSMAVACLKLALEMFLEVN